MKKLNKIFVYMLFLIPMVIHSQETDTMRIETVKIDSSEDVPSEDVPSEDVPSEDVPSKDVPSKDVPYKIDYNFIDSYPQNAQVYVNDDLIGNTPLFFVWNDSTFPKTLKISLKGFSLQTETVNSKQLVNKKYILRSTGKILLINPVKENKQTYFNSPRKVVPIVISSIVTAGSGIAAFYYKSLASDNRKDYEIYGDQSSLDRERKYNVLGSVSLAVLQLGFGALIYYLFFN